MVALCCNKRLKLSEQGKIEEQEQLFADGISSDILLLYFIFYHFHQNQNTLLTHIEFIKLLFAYPSF
jgi:hypothetical protein